MVSQDFTGPMNGSPRAFPPAPVDPAALATALLPFGQSRMLPPAAYTSAEVFDWERRHFFGGGWTCAAHSSRLPAIGDQLAVETGNGGALLVRGEDGQVRAFANTCRHRGHQLLPCGSSATGKAIVCPYHSWAYSLSGELRGAPGYREIPGFDASAWPLVSLPAVEWHGLVFVDGRGGGAAAAGRARRDRRPVRAGAAGCRRLPQLRRRGELEDPDRELPRVLSLPDDPPGALQRLAPAQRGELPGLRVVDRRVDVAARRRGDDVPRRPQRRGATAGAAGVGAAHGGLRRDLPQRAAEPAPGLRHDAHPHPGGGGPDPDRLLVGVRARGGRQRVL